MTVKQPPRRERRLNSIFAEQGGIRQYVFAQYEAGKSVEAISEELTRACDERIPADTLYQWMRKWRQETNREGVTAAA